ncbi:hypothetical protein BRADI_5g00313v3, partial [Brachypodium distachyon]
LSLPYLPLGLSFSLSLPSKHKRHHAAALISLLRPCPAKLRLAVDSSLTPRLLDPQINFYKTPPTYPETATLAFGMPWPQPSPSGPARPTSSSSATTTLLPTISLAARTTTTTMTAMASRHGSGAAAIADDG